MITNATTALPAAVSTINWLEPLRDHPVDPGAILDWIPSAATDFRTEFLATGTPESIQTCDLVTLPYPTRFGLWRIKPTFTHHHITHHGGAR